jgi:Proteasome stabiliser
MASRDTELEAVEAALDTLALADTDAALEKVVARLLPGLLAALATKSAAARAKIVQTLQHINVRVRASPEIALPFDAVLAVAVDPEASVMTRNVAIQGGYVARCFARHSSQAAAFKHLVVSAGSVSGGANRDALLALSLKALRARVRETSSASRSNADAAFRTMLDEFDQAQLDCLLTHGLHALQGRTKEPASNAELLALVRMCVDYAGIQEPERGAKVFPLLLVASGDTSRDAVSSAGDDALKRIDTCDILLQHEPMLVQTLFDLFLDVRADIPLRCLVLSKGLLRASLSASCFPEVHQVIQESVYKPGLPDRLRSLGMQYLSFVVGNGTDGSLRENGLELLQGMLKVIRDETDGSPSFSPIVRGFAYTALGEIMIRVPSLLSQHAHTTPELFFTAAQSASEPSEVRSAASQALSVLAPVFSVESNDSSSAIRRDSVLDVLRRTVQNGSDLASSARLAAVLWANQCFAFGDSSARMINIICVGDKRPDVREAAAAGLCDKRFRGPQSLVSNNSSNREPVSSKSNVNKFNCNDTVEANKDVDKFCIVQGQGMSPQKVNAYPVFEELMTEFDNAMSGYAGRPPLELHPNSWGVFLRFALVALRHNASDFMCQLNLSRPSMRKATPSEVKNYVEQKPSVKLALDQLWTLADRCLFNDRTPSGPKVEYAAVHTILFLSDVYQSNISSRYATHIDRIISICAKKSGSGNSVLVEGLAKLSGVATLSLSNEASVATVARLTTLLQPEGNGHPSGRHGEDERVSGALCLGYIVSALQKIEGALSSESQTMAVCALASRMEGAVESSLFVRIAACNAIAVVAVKAPLPLQLDASLISSGPPQVSRKFVVTILTNILKDDKSDAKLVEAAALASGRICVGESRSSFKSSVVDALLATAVLRKEDEVRFSVGESLVRTAVGFDSPPPTSSQEDEDMNEEEELFILLRCGRRFFEVAAPIDDLEGTVTWDVANVLKAATELCQHPRPQARAAGCVFLVSFLRLVGTQNAVKEWSEYKFESAADRIRFESAQQAVSQALPIIQRAFTTLLGDRSDFSQQLASRGISLVYDLSTEDEQRELVSSLVRSLTSGKKRAATTVAGDEGGLLDINGLQILPEASTSGTATGTTVGSSSSGAATYKELCSLATDMGQPDLVYKFLDLAGHTALWNNRRGAALAGSALLGGEVAAEQLRPHIKVLVPRLYVYCYDPAEGVRMAMSSVLRSVAQASGFGSIAVAVTEYFDAVAEHCLRSMTSSQWRVREAGCAALRDLLSSRRWPEVEQNLHEFWYIGLRAMDDIKESVRIAAEGTGRALAALSIRLCDSNLSGVNNASSAVAIVVPCILPAFTHGVKEVRVLATETLSKIIRCGGIALKSSVPEIAESLLEAATELEPVALNYVQFHVDADQREQLEEARADAASMSGSPVMDSLERLSALVDEEIAPIIVSKLVRLARNGIGVPTRAATARFFCTLLSGRGVIMVPHASKLMNSAMAAARMEAHGAARRAWSNAVGLAARLAPVEAVASLVETIADISGSDSDQERALASFLALGLWRNSPDTARQHSTALLPIAYMGRYDVDHGARSASSNWKEVWSEGAPSSDAGLRMYAEEITTICIHRLATSSQYSVKRSAAAALGAMAAAHNSSVGSSSLSMAAEALVNALPGHIWDGKDAALGALGTIGSTITNPSCGVDISVWRLVGGAGVVVSALLKECSRGKKEYRLRAMEALTFILEGCRDTCDFISILTPVLSPEWDSASIDGNSESLQDVARTVQATGSDAEAVDARNKARKADRAAAVASIACLEAAFPTEACQELQQKHFVSVVDVLSRLVNSEREIRIGALERLSAVILRTHKNVFLAFTGTSAKMLSVAAKGVGDAKFIAVREGGYAVIRSMLQHMASDEIIGSLSGSELCTLQSAVSQDLATSLAAQTLASLLNMTSPAT